MATPCLAEDPSDPLPFEIHGATRGGEHHDVSFALSIPDRPIRTQDDQAYSPIQLGVDGNPLYAALQPKYKVRWDFGDGDSVLTADRVSVIHRYDDDSGNDTYTVTAIVTDRFGEIGRATKEVTILNNDPVVTLAGVEIDPDRSIVELSAAVVDAPNDTFTYTWDFGDGSTETGGPTVQHQYVIPGTYEVVLTVDDDDYGTAPSPREHNDGRTIKKRKVVVSGGGTSSGSPSEAPENIPTTQAVTTSFTGTVGGTLSTDYDGTVRSFRGLYLSQIDPGLCRFLFTAWDDTNLSWTMTIADLRGVRPEGGRFKISNPRVVMTFEPTAETYSLTKESWMGPMGSMGLGGIGQILIGGNDTLSDEQRDQAAAMLRDLAGVDATGRAPDEERPMPATSPFGIEESKSFGNVSGTLDLTFIPGDRAVGTYDLHLETSEYAKPPHEPITFQGTYSVDLVGALRDGILRYEGCEPPPFEIKSFFPEDGEQHLHSERPSLRVDFTVAADPATLTENTFQVGYRDPRGTFVPEAGRILHKPKGAYFSPNRPLRPGVRYKVRVKAGDDGARSRAGSPLEDTEGDGWRSWTFTTRVDMVPETDEKQLLACHLFQTARDVPLIVGKPAIARIYANWEEQPGVHPDDQIREFDALIRLYGTDGEIINQRHHFVRPDLWQDRGVTERSARHTAQVTGITPTEGMGRALLVQLEVDTRPGETGAIYSTRCPVRVWEAKPTLDIDFVALRLDEWLEDPALYQAVEPVLQSIADEAVELAWKLYPFAEVSGGRVRVVDVGLKSCRCPEKPENEDWDSASPFNPQSGCDADECRGAWEAVRVDLPGGNDPDGWLNPADGAGVILGGQGAYAGINDRLRNQTSADVIVAFGPHRLFNGGGSGSKISEGTGVVVALGSLESQHFPRYVMAVVHELGHALGLQHLPYLQDGEGANENRKLLGELREGTPPFEYAGIEGLLMSRDGQSWRNRSSQEGNQDDDRLFPLMFPSTLPIDALFIANHHYRQIQKLLE